MTSRGSASARALAFAWLLLVLALVVHQVQFWRDARLDTDVMALLPADARSALADQAVRQLADGASREVAVLVGAPAWEQARAAARRFSAALGDGGGLLQPQDRLAAFDFDAALDFYRPWRDRLLTDGQRQMLRAADGEDLARQALARLYQLSAGPRLTQWSEDPLGLWPQWWLARAGATRVQERDGLATVEADGRHWVVLSYRITRPAFSASGATDYADLLARARAAAQADPAGAVEVIAAGIPLHAEAAAAQANREMNVIGLGSLAAVLLLVWLAFRSLRPIVLVALSLAIGTAAALSVTALVFERVHLITLVFGASLVGVAEDYGIHYFVARQAEGGAPPRRVMRALLPGMALALATSVVAYLALGIAPFPGLRQMALFSATGLVAACLTVVLWFPWLDRGGLRPTPLSQRLAANLARWPRVGANRATVLLALALAVWIVPGLMRLQVADDVRQLQSSPAALVAAQRAAGRLLAAPSPAQFVLVRGGSPDQVLEREEAARAALAPLLARQELAGLLALSDWVPSARRQQADAALAAPLEAAARARVAQALGGAAVVPARAPARSPLRLEDWLRHPVSAMLRPLWLGRIDQGYASVILLQGLERPGTMRAVADAVSGLSGVQWVDRVDGMSRLLRHYRQLMSWLLLAGAAGVALLLAWRYGRASWRALAPTLLAALAALALLGWLQMPLQLFSVLALALLLGVGVDYGIFLLEHPGDGASWTAVVLGAASTLLAFGLLALSATPALRVFGLTMLAGVGTVWGLAPWFRPAQAPGGAPGDRGFVPAHPRGAP